MLDLPYYRLALDDYATAAFTSFSKDYYGTLDDILRLMDALENDEDLCKSQQALITAFHSFEQGDTAVQYPVAYQNVPLLTEANVLHQENRQYRDFSWTHWNTWQCPYYLRCEEVAAVHLWLQCPKQLCRCVKARFRNLEYRSSHSHDWKPLGDMLWGFPEMIVYGRPFFGIDLQSSKNGLTIFLGFRRIWQLLQTMPIPTFRGFVMIFLGTAERWMMV